MRPDWNKIIDGVQTGLVWFVIILVTTCTATLILFDVFAGTGIDYYLTQGNLEASIAVSMATTGLLMALMFIGYSMMEKKRSGLIKSVGMIILVISGAVFCTDVIFDGLTADILSFGTVMNLSTVPNAWVHWLFRFLLGGISMIGEALAVAIIIGMPVLKGIIGDALPNYGQPRQSTYQPPRNQQTYRSATSVPAALQNSAYNTAYKAKPAPIQTTFMAPEPTYSPISYDEPN
jgi:hypothetical protein